MKLAWLCVGLLAVASSLGCATPVLRPVPPPIDPRGWLELRSPDFTIATNADEKMLRKLARDLERFIAVVEEATTLNRVGPTLPTRIYVFRTFSQYLRAGGQRGTSGEALSTNDGIFVHFPLDQSRDSTRTVLYHEFVHSLMQTGHSDYPLWYHEGLAEMLSTLQVRDGAVAIGFVPSFRRPALLSEELIPLEELLTTLSISGMTLEQASLFYAQSWAFVHYLHGPRSRQLSLYLAALNRGDEWRSAFEDAFDAPLETIEAEFREYWLSLRRGVRFFNRREPSREREPQWSIAPVLEARMADALAQLLLSHGVDAVPQAEPYLRYAIAADARHAASRAALGWCRALAADDVAADAALAGARAIEPESAAVWLYTGRIALARADRAEGEARRVAIADARDAFVRSAALAPEHPAAWAEFGASYLLEETNSPEDLAAALDALHLAHERGANGAGVELGLGVLYARAGEPSRAIEHLRRAAQFTHSAETSEQAQKLLDELAE